MESDDGVETTSREMYKPTFRECKSAFDVHSKNRGFDSRKKVINFIRNVKI